MDIVLEEERRSGLGTQAGWCQPPSPSDSEQELPQQGEQRWRSGRLVATAEMALVGCQPSSAAVQQCGRLYWALAFQSVAAISEAAITTIVLLLWVGGVIFNAVRTLYFMFIDTRSHGM